MAEFGRRAFLGATIIAAGVATLGVPALAQRRNYHLIVEDGIDAISVRQLVAAYHGAPVTVDRVPRALVRDPAALAALVDRLDGAPALIVGCPALIAAVEGSGRRTLTRDRRLRAEIGRALPDSAVELGFLS